jgi:hypothetical protein
LSIFTAEYFAPVQETELLINPVASAMDPKILVPNQPGCLTMGAFGATASCHVMSQWDGQEAGNVFENCTNWFEGDR